MVVIVVVVIVVVVIVVVVGGRAKAWWARHGCNKQQRDRVHPPDGRLQAQQTGRCTFV